ncbi:MAG: Hsp20/alpha crystallin family protein [candidate division Zixibacteria bacterium]|nr:Hsp20/alpha crystallin family protein [candidate division Zixibacteria bacterium]
MTLVRYNPNRVLNRISQDFDSVLDSFFRAPVFKNDASCDFMPRVDIVEDKESINLHVELPGMKKDDIKVLVEDGVLRISGERKQESEIKDRNYIRAERIYGSFSRSFTLPDNVEGDNISADYKDGVLNVTLRKLEKAKPKEIAVQVK